MSAPLPTLPRAQLELFSAPEPRFDPNFSGLRRTELEDGAWFELLPGWLAGHQALLDQLVAGTRLSAERVLMYERVVDVPRLCAVLGRDGPIPPVVAAMQRALSARYGEDFVRLSLGYYRDGRDSVALHGDQIARRLPEAVVATVSLGAPRRFVLRRKAGGRSLSFPLGRGDLLVMGGSCQRTWQHGIPKSRTHAGGPRLALMFRPAWQEP
jgi:alkylated DNA repair dioxygenase AlkB